VHLRNVATSAHSIELYERKHRGGFLEKSACPPSSENLLKHDCASYFSIVNYAINLDSCGEYSCALGSPLALEKEEI
jgi:hypothetical protein